MEFFYTLKGSDYIADSRVGNHHTVSICVLSCRLLLTASLLVIAGCAAFKQQNDIPVPPPPVDVPPAPVPVVVNDDPDAIIDQASQTFIETEINQAQPVVWTRLLNNFEFPDCSEGSVAATWQAWYAKNNDYMQRVWTRASPWLHDVINETQARRLPVEFALLPVVESAYNVFAHSHAGAVGSWQFTAATAKDYQLPVNQWYDGRRDMYAATRAALNLLRAHMDRYKNNWALSLAAYNSGPGRVNRALRRAGLEADNASPAAMRLPLETRTFAPKLHGLVCSLRHTDIDELPKIIDEPAIDTVELEQPIDLAVAALLADVPVETLYTLNAGLSNNSTPPTGPHRVILPVDKIEPFEGALASTDLSSYKQSETLTVERGDTLARLAKRHSTSVTELKTLNSLRNDLIYPGQRLLTQATSFDALTGYDQARKELDSLQSGLVPVTNARHKIRSGENLGSIARRYGVSVGEIQRWNNITNPHRIRAGQLLLLNTTRRVATRSNVRNYRVQPGDSLWRIARRHSVSVDSLRSWNSLRQNTILQPGQILRVQP